jgi:hypothetical protein
VRDCEQLTPASGVRFPWTSHGTFKSHAGFAEAGASDDLRHRGTLRPKFLDSLNLVGQQSRLSPKLDSLRLGLGDTVHLALTTDVVLELGDESKTQ